MQDNDERLGTRHPIKPAVMGFPADKATCRMQTFECSLLRPLEYICIFNFVARNFPQGVISSFLVYIATDGIYRKKAEVVGRWFDRPTTKNVEKEVLFNVRTSQFEPISKCRFFGKNERKTGIFGTLERCWREKQERTKKLNFPYCYGHLQKCVD